MINEAMALIMVACLLVHKARSTLLLSGRPLRCIDGKLRTIVISTALEGELQPFAKFEEYSPPYETSLAVDGRLAGGSSSRGSSFGAIGEPVPYVRRLHLVSMS